MRSSSYRRATAQSNRGNDQVILLVRHESHHKVENNKFNGYHLPSTILWPCEAGVKPERWLGGSTICSQCAHASRPDTRYCIHCRTRDRPMGKKFYRRRRNEHPENAYVERLPEEVLNQAIERHGSTKPTRDAAKKYEHGSKLDEDGYMIKTGLEQKTYEKDLT